jgi:hypothetical protein
MKIRGWLLGFLLLLTAAVLIVRAQTETHVYTTADAKNHIGEFASVVGIVEQVASSKKGTQFLDFDGKYPDEPFAAVVFASDVAAVGDVKKYESRRVIVTGKITLYRGRPEIIVREPEALKIAP